MRRTVSLLLFAVACVAFAPAPLPRRERGRDDPNAVFGKWEFVVWEMNGRRSEASQYLELTTEKVEFVSLVGGNRVTYKFIVRPNESPRAFHWLPEGGGGWFGCYRVVGNELTMVFKTGGSWEDRPRDFDGNHEYRFVLKRRP